MGVGGSALTSGVAGGERLPPSQEGNIQAPEGDAKNSQLQGDSGLGVAAGGFLK